MSGSLPGPEPERAAVRPRRFSLVWLIPVASVVIGGWLLWTSLSREGPTVHITFATAEGLQAGQSQVKFKDVQMGTVQSLDLTPDRSLVDIRVRMTSKAADLLTEGAQFWVVKPRVFGGEISGLNTVLSGAYLAMEPGGADKPAKRDFVGLEDPPTFDPAMRGRRFLLTAPRIGAINIGSPIFFHGLEVGKVLVWKPVGMASSIALTAFIQTPYDRWVHDDSRFWDTSGVALTLNAEGVHLEVNSLKAALLGGLSFDTASPESAPESQEHQVFTLYDSEVLADSATGSGRVMLASYFTGTVGGLAVGAPVTLQGAPIGAVTSVDLQYDTDANQPRVRAGFAVLLNRVAPVGSKVEPPSADSFRQFVAQGLRARLKGGNLLTGQKEVELAIEEAAPPAEARQEGDVMVIPASVGGAGLDDVTAKVSSLVAKLDSVPFADIGRNLNGTLQGVSSIINGEPLRQAISHLNATLAALQGTIQHIDSGTAPALRRLPAIANELQDTLSQIRRLTGSIAAGAGSDTKFGRDLDGVLTQVGDAAQSVETIADLLSRHPEALIRGRVLKAAGAPR